MAINEHGEVSGQVSGGCVEGAVAAIADDVIRTGEPQLLHFGIADDDAWEVGLPCGGEIDVWVQACISGDRGLREMLRGGRLIECADVCSGRDVDTPDDLEAIRPEARAVG